MATKKQKRERAEAKREKFLAEVRADGLRAQKADHARQRLQEERAKAADSRINQRHRSILLANGINPSTGLLFTDDQLTAMREKANTAERKQLYDKIVEGRKAALANANGPDWTDEELLEIKSTYPDAIISPVKKPLDEITVGEFRDKVDQLYTGMGWNL